MTEVRLTATTPDGQVVYVLANEKGELKLEEPIAPPEFDGNLDGDLDVTGTINAAGIVQMNGDYFRTGGCSSNDTSSGVECYKAGLIAVQQTKDSSSRPNLITAQKGKDEVFFVDNTGSIETAGTIKVGDPVGNAFKSGLLLGSDGAVAAYVNNSTTELPRIYVYNGDTTSYTAQIKADGSAEFAGGKAGFTPEGNLFCTTLRGDLVVLENTSGGFGAWVEYVPPARKDLLEDKLESWSEKDKSPEIKPIQD